MKKDSLPPTELPPVNPAEVQSDAGPVVQLELKSETEDQLITNLFRYGEWDADGTQLVHNALVLAQQLHSGQMYKERPYIYHPLRIANRIVRYMGIRDPKIIAAALLHDAVEDHAGKLVNASTITDEVELQWLALESIGVRIDEEVADIVAAVTNEPARPGIQLSREEKLAIYAAKVETATSTFGGWVVKFGDWCENAPGIIFTDFPVGSEQLSDLKQKYGGPVFDIHVARYKQYRDQLSPEAANYVATQLTLAFQRLVLELPRD